MNIELPFIYPLTDRKLSGLTHDAQVNALCSAGAKIIQLREKALSAGEFLAEAFPAVRTAHELGVKVLINDRVDIAKMTQADGVHLGQGDLPPASARRILGDEAIIGLSTHNIDQVKAAATQPIDYIAFGPIFDTETKSDHDPVTGLATLVEIRKLIPDIPLVAIGGINADNILSVRDAGADSVAVIKALFTPTKDVAVNLKNLSLLTSTLS